MGVMMNQSSIMMTKLYGGLLILVAAVAMLAVAGAGADQLDGRDLYSRLCQDQVVADFRRISQAKALIEFAESEDAQSIDCDKKYREAILDLSGPLTEDDPDNHCTPERVNLITFYIEKHIKRDTLPDEIPDPIPEKRIPQSLKHFFIGFSLDVSKICKLGMLKLLFEEEKQNLYKEDFKAVQQWAEGADWASKQLRSRAVNYDDMFMVGNAICDSGVQKCRYLYVQTEHHKRLQSMRATCHLTFKPFYSKLILPIVRLANVGIDYQGDEMQDKLDAFRENPELQKWAKLVFLCESILYIVPMDLPKEQKAALFHVSEEDLEKMEKYDQEELREELKEKIDEQEHSDGEQNTLAGVEEDLIPLHEPCDGDKHNDDEATKEHVTAPSLEESPVDLGESAEKKHEPLLRPDGDGAEVKVECKDGQKFVKIKKTTKSKNFLTKFGKDIVKEMRKLQQERKAYLLSKKNMPVTNIMLHVDVVKYEKEHGKINTEDFGDEKPIVFEPKPQIRLADNLIPANDKRILKAIKKYEDSRKALKLKLKRISKKFTRTFRRVLWMGRVKFGGKAKRELDTNELMLKVFDEAMWVKDNRELTKTLYGKVCSFLDFQNYSNLATWFGLIFSIVVSLLGWLGILSGR